MKNKSWFKTKGYLHFTNKTNPKINRAAIFQLVRSPKLVARHAFFPLIHKKIKERRYKKVKKNGQTVRKHAFLDKNGKLKHHAKIRPIHYATHIDQHIYAYYSKEILQKKYEAYLKSKPELSDCITAYRQLLTEDGHTYKRNIHFAHEIFEYIKKKGNCIVIAVDIKSFFTSLNHSYLKKAWAALLDKTSLPKDHYNLYKSITKFAYINLEDLRQQGKHGFNEKQLAALRREGVHAFFESPAAFRKQVVQNPNIKIRKNQYKGKDGLVCGIPQGLPISAMLANLYLLAFDEQVLKEIVTRHQTFYRRYSDDIIVVCSEQDYLIIEEQLYELIKPFKLTISEEKTEITAFRYDENHRLMAFRRLSENTWKSQIPLTYLGFEFYGYQTLIKSKSIAKFYRRMKQTVKSKRKRLRKLQEKYPEENHIMFKRKIYKSYSHLGKKRGYIFKRITYHKLNETTAVYEAHTKEIKKRSWGNFLTYVDKASEIMNEPAIKKQLKRHWEILQAELGKE